VKILYKGVECQSLEKDDIYPSCYGKLKTCLNLNCKYLISCYNESEKREMKENNFNGGTDE